MEEAVDVVHRGGEEMYKKTRQVIVLFAHRRVKEEIWRRSKGSPVCKERGSHGKVRGEERAFAPKLKR